MFRDAFKSKRCLIPASGCYEWHDARGGKQSYYFTRDGQPITFAGRWSKWNDEEAGNNLLSCTMVIAEPNKFVAEVHDAGHPRGERFRPMGVRRHEGRRDVDEAGARGRVAEVVRIEAGEQRAPDDDASLIDKMEFEVS